MVARIIVSIVIFSVFGPILGSVIRNQPIAVDEVPQNQLALRAGGGGLLGGALDSELLGGSVNLTDRLRAFGPKPVQDIKPLFDIFKHLVGKDA